MTDDYAQTWSAYVQQQLNAHANDLPLTRAAEVAGITYNTLKSWVAATGSQPSATNVLSFWRAYGDNTTLPEAMSAAGYGEVSEYDTVIRTQPDPSLLDTEELLGEMRNRVGTNPLVPGATTAQKVVDRKPASLRSVKLDHAKKAPPL